MLTDLRLGLRLVVRQPFLALTAIGALTVGIGLATVGFATMEAFLFSRLPFPNGDRFVRITSVSALGQQPVLLAPEDYVRLAAIDGLEHLGAATGSRESVALPTGAVTDLQTTAITPSSFRHLSAVPISGRLLAETDAGPGQPNVALLSESAWRRHLNGDPSAVGAQVAVGAARYTVVGILPSTFEFPNAPDLWLPLDERFLRGAALPESDARLFGLRAPDVPLDVLERCMATVARQAKAGDEAIVVTMRAFTDIGSMAVELSIAIVVTVIAVFLVIAANVGNLVLARSMARSREFALRAALGASRGRLITQIASEVLVLGSVAAVLGSLGARAVLRQFHAMDDLPYWVDFTGGPLTAVLVVGTTLLATLVAGAWPALRATRRDLLPGLQGGDGRASHLRFGRTAGAMVVVQIAVSVVMLHGALVVARAFRDYANVNLDLPANVVTGFGAPLRWPW